MLALIAACTFGTVTLLVVGLTMKSEREIMQERMRAHSQVGQVGPSVVELDLEAAFRERILLPFLRWFAGIGMRFTPSGATQAIEEKLETAGRPWNLGSREFVGLKVLSILIFVVLGIVAWRVSDTSPPLRLLLLIVIIFIGVILPDFLLQRAINQRQFRIRRALADTLDLLSVSVEAGLGLDGAMQKVIEKLKGPLSDEMGRALQEMQIGKLRADALKDMAKRVKVQELSTFVAAVCQADQLGVSIAKVLRVQSETLRTQRSQRAREAAARLPVKMLFPLVIFIFPVIFIVIAGPGAILIARAFGIGK
ncbi:MAG TPA: type II secretion system F family protein [Armatimonadota bacterium]|nr:type II secretion system F family protein [Armatimonadota bacterium]